MANEKPERPDMEKVEEIVRRINELESRCDPAADYHATPHVGCALR